MEENSQTVTQIMKLVRKIPGESIHVGHRYRVTRSKDANNPIIRAHFFDIDTRTSTYVEESVVCEALADESLIVADGADPRIKDGAHELIDALISFLETCPYLDSSKGRVYVITEEVRDHLIKMLAAVRAVSTDTKARQ